MLNQIHQCILNQPSISFEQYFTQYVMKLQDLTIEQEIKLQLSLINHDIITLNRLIEKHVGGLKW